MFDDYIKEINSKYSMETYNFLHNNCNHFTHEISEFLTGNPLLREVLSISSIIFLNSLIVLFALHWRYIVYRMVLEKLH